jgi:hypothetical protein
MTKAKPTFEQMIGRAVMTEQPKTYTAETLRNLAEWHDEQSVTRCYPECRDHRDTEAALRWCAEMVAWQPIDRALKNSTRYYGCDADGQCSIFWWDKRQGFWMCDDPTGIWNEERFSPVVFVVLPTPPTEKGAYET